MLSRVGRLTAVLVVWGTVSLACLGAGSKANRLAYLDQDEPFGVGRDFPRLTTRQWFGEPDVDAVVTLGIDDLGGAVGKYEAFLRPILERLKQVEGRAALSVFCNAVPADDPQVRRWIEEGVNLEVHTLSHPCPILARSNLTAAVETFLGSVDLLHRVPGNRPVAFRTPCCDSINSPSPRLYAEIFSRRTTEGRFLQADSSIMNVFTSADPALPREGVVDGTGAERFRRYLPFPSFVTTVENYPYPFVVGGKIWEFPGVVPSDWEAQHVQGVSNAVTTADWKAALDLVVAKQGTFNLIFHPHGWCSPAQVIELIDHATARHGRRVRFLNFAEAVERLTSRLLGGEALRGLDGGDNGVRLVDLDDDGFLDVLIGNARRQVTRLWQPGSGSWREFPLPVQFNREQAGGSHVRDPRIHLGILDLGAGPRVAMASEATRSAWVFAKDKGWEPDLSLLRGLEAFARPSSDADGVRDRGIRFRDVDGDGTCEVVMSAVGSTNRIFRWDRRESRWKDAPYALPEGTAIVTAQGADQGLRFVDVNEDGHDDVLYSGPDRYSLHLWVPGAGPSAVAEGGWTHEVTTGRHGTGPSRIPPIVRGGPKGARENNGFWIHSGRAWWQNEDTAHLPDHVDRRRFAEWLAGDVAVPRTPEQSLADLVVHPGFAVELVASDPLIGRPVAIDWDARGRLWVLEQSGPARANGAPEPRRFRIRVLEDADADGRPDRGTVFLDDLDAATAILPWRDGILVLSPPDLFHAEDTSGDGVADTRKVLFTGFGEAMADGPGGGMAHDLDGWIHGGAGGAGGRIRSAQVGAEVILDGRDFRFRPDRGEFEALEGLSQFGRVRNDSGDWFGNDGGTWAWFYAWQDRYADRNPLAAIERRRCEVVAPESADQVFGLLPTPPRRLDPGTARVAAPSGAPAVYRDDLFGPEWSGALFVPDAHHAVVRGEWLSRRGIEYVGRHAGAQEGREFLASRDPGFEPRQVKLGPDGALHVVDAQGRGGRGDAGRGRIFRVLREGVSARAMTNLSRMDEAGLMKELASPNGWRRDTAQRLLVERRSRRSVVGLEGLLRDAPDARVRLQALATMEQLGVLDEDRVVASLRDPDPAVRLHALRIVERILPGSRRRDLDWQNVLAATAVDPDLGVRRQTALLLGQWPGTIAARLLALMASESPLRPEVKSAIISSLVPHATAFLEAESATGAKGGSWAELRGAATAARALQFNDGARADRSAYAEKIDWASRPDVQESRARAQVVTAWIPRVRDAMAQADATRGERQFHAACAACHALRGAGAESAAGPDLGKLPDYRIDRLVTAILDPSRSVDDRYKTRVVELLDGESVSGIVAAQGANGIVLQLPDGSRRTLLRSGIKQVRRLERSPMPEKYENSLTPGDVADILKFLGAK